MRDWTLLTPVGALLFGNAGVVRDRMCTPDAGRRLIACFVGLADYRVDNF